MKGIGAQQSKWWMDGEDAERDGEVEGSMTMRPCFATLMRDFLAPQPSALQPWKGPDHLLKIRGGDATPFQALTESSWLIQHYSTCVDGVLHLFKYVQYIICAIC